MAEPEKKRRFSNIFKTKDANGKVSGAAGATVTMAEGTGSGSPGEDGPRGGRRKLFTQLSESEKSMRRSTLGSAQLSQATQAPQPPPPAASGQMAAASANSKGVLFSRPTTANAANPELETPFAKMVRQTGSNSTTSAGPAPGAVARQPSNPDSTSNDAAAASGARRGSNVALTAEEKKTRRKSLLAPVQNLFSGLASGGNEGQSSGPSSAADASFSESSGGAGVIGSTSGGLSSSAASLDGKDKKKKNLFGKGKGLDFQTGLQLDDSQAKLQKERQKKLQKELDKIDKEKAKQEKARQARLLDVLQQTLELGEERAQIPMPSHRSVFAIPMRPPTEAH